MEGAQYISAAKWEAVLFLLTCHVFLTAPFRRKISNVSCKLRYAPISFPGRKERRLPTKDAEATQVLLSVWPPPTIPFLPNVALISILSSITAKPRILPLKVPTLIQNLSGSAREMPHSSLGKTVPTAGPAPDISARNKSRVIPFSRPFLWVYAKR